MRLLLLLLPTFGALALPVTATAGGGHGCGVVEHIFEMADQDSDGALSPDEYDAAGLERYGVTFEQTDANGDGETTLAEYLELYERYHGPPDDAGDTV